MSAACAPDAPGLLALNTHQALSAHARTRPQAASCLVAHRLRSLLWPLSTGARPGGRCEAAAAGAAPAAAATTQRACARPEWA